MKYLSAVLLLSAGLSANAGHYNAYIKQLQVEGPNDAYNSVHLDIDVQDSPCTSTNQSDRFAIENNSYQQSAALAALMADKKISLMSTGTCNDAGIERTNYIMIKRNQ